jgi:hypothetical protein
MLTEPGELVPAADFRDLIVGLIGTIEDAKKYTWAEDPVVAEFIRRLDGYVTGLAGLLPENSTSGGVMQAPDSPTGFMTRWRKDSRERRYWRDLLARFGVHGVRVREVTRDSGGLWISCRSRAGTVLDPDLAGRIAVHKRLPRGSVRIVSPGSSHPVIWVCEDGLRG